MTHLFLARHLDSAQRVLALALLVPTLLLLTLTALPALVVLPFRDTDARRALALLAAHTEYARTLLDASRPKPNPATGTATPLERNVLMQNSGPETGKYSG
ncbi:hypothetical protein ABZX95_44075 [Streptomyces sp. NPDC004232]|uniref:hypothetical protein n=1 Tax=Streptomyces sp. NPDC004232 TaxID=3154454 RepID=UPI0033B42745